MSAAPANKVHHPVSANVNPLQQYQAQLQANQAALGQQLPPQQRQPAAQSSSVSIATQQQQQLMSKAMEKQNEVQLDKSRVTLLLEINAELLKEVLNVQPRFKSPEEAKNDPIFRECMRRLQQNLAYLAAIADRSHKPASHIPACPGVLLPPPDMPVLESLYQKLHELYPGVNPANPPQPGQNPQIAAPRVPQNVSPRPQIQQALPEGMPPPQHSPSHTTIASPPSQVPHHQSPPPSIQQRQPTQHPQQSHISQQQQVYQTHPTHVQAHSQSPISIQPPQQIPPQYAAQMQQRQAIMHARAQQQQAHMGGQISIPTSIGMAMTGVGMNGITSMAPQQAIGTGMIGGVSMGPGGGIGGMNSYGGMGGMATSNNMGGVNAMGGIGSMGQMNNPAMNSMAMGINSMATSMAQGGFGEMAHQQMWAAPGSNWQGP